MWGFVKDWWNDDQELISIAKAMEAAPEGKRSQKYFIEALGEELAKSPEKAAQLKALLGGEKGAFKMIGGDESKFVEASQVGGAGADMLMQGGKGSDFSRAKQEQK